MEIFGFLAAFTTTIAFLPQTLKTIKNRNTQGISFIMYLVFTIGVFMWIVYALYIGDFAILLANLFTFIFSTIILFVKFYNVRKKHERI